LSNPDIFKAGWVRDAHGLKGELYIQLAAKKADWLDSFEEFWLETRDGRKGFSVERAKPHKDGLIVKSDKIQDRTQAEALKGADFLIPTAYLDAAEGETIFLKQIEGFRLRNGENEMGVIVGFASNGAQDLLTVKTATKEILVPFVADFIRQIDFDNRVVIMELPEGLDDEGEA
jgi:16S rRNA processing protein RimM